MADFILIEKTQGVAIITRNRPAQLNAMSRQLSEGRPTRVRLST